MRVGLIWLACLALVAQATAHGLQPSYRIIRFQQGFTRFELEAFNAFEYTETFYVDLFEDESFAFRIDDFNAVPSPITLGPGDSRHFTVEMDEITLPWFYACTSTARAGGVTRVCARVDVCSRTESNLDCLNRVRGERSVRKSAGIEGRIQ